MRERVNVLALIYLQINKAFAKVANKKKPKPPPEPKANVTDDTNSTTSGEAERRQGSNC